MDPHSNTASPNFDPTPRRLPAYTLGAALPALRAPFLLGRFTFDTHDIRSTAKLSGSLCLAVPVLSLSPDVSWTPEMLRPVDPAALHPVPPELRPPDPPEAANAIANGEAFLRTVLRHHRIRMWRNPTLSLYSRPGQERAEFDALCRQAAISHHQAELRALEDRLRRGLERVEQATPRGWPTQPTELEQVNRANLIHQTRDAIRRLLTEWPTGPRPVPGPAHLPTGDDTSEKLAEIVRQANREAERLADRLELDARDIEPYDFRLRVTDLALGELGLLWLATGGEPA